LIESINQVIRYHFGDIVFGDIDQSQSLWKREKKVTYNIMVGQCHQFYVT